MTGTTDWAAYAVFLYAPVAAAAYARSTADLVVRGAQALAVRTSFTAQALISADAAMGRINLSVDARLVAAHLPAPAGGPGGLVPVDAAPGGADGLLAGVGRLGTGVTGVTRTLAATEALLRTARPRFHAGRAGMAAAVTGGGDLVAGQLSSLGSRNLLGRVERLLVRRLPILRRVVILTGACVVILPGVFAAVGPRATALLGGSVPVALVAISEGFRGCPRQQAAEQCADQRAQSRTPGSLAGQGTGKRIEAISIHGPILNEIERTTQRVE